MITKITEDGIHSRVDIEYDFSCNGLLGLFAKRHIEAVAGTEEIYAQLDRSVLRVTYKPAGPLTAEAVAGFRRRVGACIEQAGERYGEVAAVIGAQLGNYAERQTLATLHDGLNSRLNRVERLGAELRAGLAEIREVVAGLAAAEQGRQQARGAAGNGRGRAPGGEGS